MVRFAQEAASGLLHLHREKVVHRDVATRNLLLNESWHIKVQPVPDGRASHRACTRQGAHRHAQNTCARCVISA